MQALISAPLNERACTPLNERLHVDTKGFRRQAILDLSGQHK
jgi:hypothetical protein